MTDDQGMERNFQSGMMSLSMDPHKQPEKGPPKKKRFMKMTNREMRMVSGVSEWVNSF